MQKIDIVPAEMARQRRISALQFYAVMEMVKTLAMKNTEPPEISVDACVNGGGCNLDADRHFVQIVKAINGDAGYSHLISCEHKKLVYSMSFFGNSFTLLQCAVILRRLDVLADFLALPEVDVNQVSGGNVGVTALHLAADANFEEGVRLLVDKGAEVDALDASRFTPLHRACLYKSTEAARALIKAGASLKTPAPDYFSLSALYMVLRKTPKAVDAVDERLDACITFQKDDGEENVKLQFDLTEWQCDDAPVSLLHVFAKEHDLEHPLLRVLLEESWKRAKGIYYARIAFGVLFLISIAAYVYSKGEPQWQVYILLALTLCDLLRKAASFASFANSPTAFRFWKTLTTYLQSFDNCCEIFCYFGALAFWQGDQGLKDSIGPMVFLACWFKFIVMISEFRVFGLYIDMYYFVLKSFLKLILSFGVYLLGFIICFCLYFRDEDHFSSLLTALVKLAAMMVGELEYGELVKSIPRHNGTERAFVPLWLVGANGFYGVFPLACILIFLVAVPIVLMSLLLGIVVQDVNLIKNKAHSIRLSRRAELAEYCLVTFAHVSRIFKPLWQYGKSDSAYKVNIVRKEYAFNDVELPAYMHEAHEIATRNSLMQK